ncbi:MAG: RIP metalloprotease RseP [Flavobacteriaceae bacterium]|jgi:regulator of sigma E protease|nr:RIP metalloprotease RseP [Flavobacteriaceae bacterium]MBT4415162.1 RIP metalloprotease RseP [Flavobacteriaceae bacterium]MBT5012314.1 RIP metalloprotease RseP [Flavobacteriaceae bacterium]MBT5857361.1 RIP metalloprotease RseP [Flavobacteriaceae bacterium]MBT7010230.1 RIP metalloprotease RseP [Flavobacteriaceae bacterium]
MSIFLIKAFQLILSLAILVVLHELGHFIPAKLFKTKVEKFYLFFDWPFSLYKKKIGETEYGIGVLPLGGYVKIAGMIDESMDTEHLNKEPEPWEFRSKPAWQRLIIMLGGVTVNIILGFGIYMMIMFVWGKTILPSESIPDGWEVSEYMESIGFQDGDNVIELDGEKIEDLNKLNALLLNGPETFTVIRSNGKRDVINFPQDAGVEIIKEFKSNVFPFIPLWLAVIDSVVPNSPAELSGLLKGDEIKSINNQKVITPIAFQEFVQSNDVDSISIGVIRNGYDIVLNSGLRQDNSIGITFKNLSIQPKKLEFNFLESISQGYDFGIYTLTSYVSQMKLIFTKEGVSQLGGFGAIGGLFPATWDWEIFWRNTAFLSLILAFMNMLPIPALDGGHVMFLCYEVVSGRKPNDKFMEYAQIAGFFLLMGLVLFANGNDLYKFLFN